MLKTNNELLKNTIKFSYKIINDLLYFDDNEKGLKLYISIIIKTEIFKFVYNEINYSNYIRIYEKFTQGLYIYNLIIKFYKFIRHYPHYQLNQIFRYKFYESF